MIRAAALLTALAMCGQAAAQEIVSITTPFDLDKCKHTPGKEEEDYGSWRCRGLNGMAIYVTAGDQRSYVSFGPKAKTELAARQTLAAFNGTGDKIEWRGGSAGKGKLKPYAAIVRYSVTVTRAGQSEEGEMIVVFRLPPGGVCHVGYVDAKANADADELARRIADERARSFKCVAGNAPVFLGTKGSAFSGPYD